MNTEKRNLQIIDFRKNGFTLQQIGNIFGITKEAVRQIIKDSVFTVRVIKLKDKTYNDDLLKYFWENTEKTDGCWPWNGRKSAGYGLFMFNKKKYVAHRLSYEIFNGKKLNKNYDVHHVCGNRFCVNPKHLEIKTKSEHANTHHPMLKYCKRGHEYNFQNTYTRACPNGQIERLCKKCQAMRKKITRS